MDSEAQDKHVQEMNLKSLRRMDPSVRNVLCVVSHVCVYRLDNGAWVKSGMEGSLFVCDRNEAPYWAFYVLNRVDITNLQVHLDPDMEVGMDNPPYMFLKEPSGLVRCLWFRDLDELSSSGELFRSLIESARQGVVPDGIQASDGAAFANNGASDHLASLLMNAASVSAPPPANPAMGGGLESMLNAAASRDAQEAPTPSLSEVNPEANHIMRLLGGAAPRPPPSPTGERQHLAHMLAGAATHGSAAPQPPLQQAHAPQGQPWAHASHHLQSPHRHPPAQPHALNAPGQTPVRVPGAPHAQLGAQSPKAGPVPATAARAGGPARPPTTPSKGKAAAILEGLKHQQATGQVLTAASKPSPGSTAIGQDPLRQVFAHVVRAQAKRAAASRNQLATPDAVAAGTAAGQVRPFLRLVVCAPCRSPQPTLITHLLPPPSPLCDVSPR